LPVLAGELGLFAKNNSSRKAINEILHAYAKSDPFTVVVSSSGLQEKGDGFHFDAVS
jgi:hypothetical protein